MIQDLQNIHKQNVTSLQSIYRALVFVYGSCFNRKINRRENVYSIGVHLFSKCILYRFAFLIGLDTANASLLLQDIIRYVPVC
jgi:hypothetical protein